MARIIPQAFYDFIKQEEGCADKVYADSGGKLTAGYGHIITGLSLGDPVNATDIANWLQDDAQIAAQRLAAQIGSDVVALLTDNQYAALISFVFNLGANPKWTIWKRLKAHQFDQVPLEMLKFVNTDVNGQMVKVQGLVNRRAAEVALWATDEPGTVDVSLSSSATRTGQTPPTPAAPGRSKALILGTAGAVAGAGPMVDQVTHAIQPYADHSQYVSHVLGFLALCAAICAGTGIFYVWLQAKNARN